LRTSTAAPCCSVPVLLKRLEISNADLATVAIDKELVARFAKVEPTS
jgi:hypothetical protein